MTLYDAALSYKELMQHRYTFLLGHKGKSENLVLSFPKENFHHLAGLHKKNIERFKNKKSAFDQVLQGDQLVYGDVPDELTDRWNCICSLKALIESNNLVFRLQKHQLPGSSIKSDYILSDNAILFFIDNSEPVSIFTARKHQLDNLNRCMRMKTLMISKENIHDGTCETIFVSPSYKKSLAQKAPPS